MPNTTLHYYNEHPDLQGTADWERHMEANGHNVESHLNARGPCARCSNLMKRERQLRYRLKRAGWVEYPHSYKNGRFREDLDTIIELIGSLRYESRTDKGIHRIRRIDN